MRKILIITCLLSTVMVAYGQKKKKDRKKEEAATTQTVDYRQLGSPMPEVRVVTKTGKTITENDLKNDANLFIMMFNPTCGHCQEEALLIQKNLDLFKQSKILFMASAVMKDYLPVFEDATKVSEYPAIQMGLDSAGFINKAFLYRDLPQVNIYDKERKLIRVFNGSTPLDSLRKYID